MRLNRLDLIRYGHFNDAAIEFPAPNPGAADVTIVFGPNEAGKSTAYQAFLELLFGLKARDHPYAFRFERNDLLVGAELDLPGAGPLTLRRNGKRTGSLIDEQDRAVEEAVLSSALHGLTRERYEERFSLDDHGLRTGGERIAGAKGDLGQLLHAGVSGLTNTAQTLDALSKRADTFHKKGGRGTELKNGKDRLKEIRAEMRTGLLTVDREAQLRAERDRRQVEFEEAEQELVRAEQRQGAARAAQIWFERSREIKRLEGELEGFADGPDLPADAGQVLAALVEKCAGLDRAVAQAAIEIEALDAEIETNPEDASAASLGAELDRLEDQQIDGAALLSRAATARADLANRLRERDDLDSAIAKTLETLGATKALVLTPDALSEIDAAVKRCTTTALEAKAAGDALAAARLQQGEAPAEPRDLNALRKAHEALRRLGDVAALRAEHRQSEAQLTRAAAGLPATWRKLIADGLPARHMIDDLARDHAAGRADTLAAAKARDAAAAQLSEAEAERAAQEAAPDAVDHDRMQDSRRKRDAAWRDHRHELAGDTAERFEAAMQADDDARARYQTGTEARQRLQAARGEALKAQTRHAALASQYDALTAELDGLSDRCRVVATAIGLPADSPPSALAERHQALCDAADADASLVNSDRALKAATDDREGALQTLVAALEAVGIDAAGGDPVDHAHRALTLEKSAREMWERWRKGDEAVAILAAEHASADQAKAAAGRQLAAATASLPLPDTSPDAMARALPHLRQLQRQTEDRSELDRRIGAMQHAIDVLTRSVKHLAQVMALDAGQHDDLAVIDMARVRLAKAEKRDMRREAALTRRARLTLQQGADRSDLESAIAAQNTVFAEQGDDDREPMERLGRLIERDRLRGERMRADGLRRDARAGVDAALFDEELSRLPDDVRSDELDRARGDAQALRDSTRDESVRAQNDHADAFAAADGSALATERATLLEELRDGARKAAVARLGVMVARDALRRLAEDRRSDMLRDVEEAFITMTQPRWKALNVWTENNGDELVGIPRQGDPVKVQSMSTGTMGQLYFALRLAGYRSFAAHPGPLPMILDDIMETFDDGRARAALELCARIGEVGQAVLFTHHAHLVDLARKTLPGVAIVDMPRREA